MKCILIVVSLMLAMDNPARAVSRSDLTDLVVPRIAAVQESLRLLEVGDAFQLAPHFELRRFLLRLTFKAGFNVEIGKLEIIPDVELVFQKDQ